MIMKKRIFAAMLAFSVLGSINVFAEQVKQPLLISANQEIGEQDMALESQYMTMAGKIESIEKGKNGYIISVTNEDMGVRFTAEETAFIVNSKDGSFMTFDELQKDMDITGIILKNGPMTLSLPPMTNAFGFVVGTENFVTTGYFDEELTSQDAQPMLQLNIAEETKIVDSKGSKKVFTADDVKEQDCMVVYGATTRSIPAQTAPVFVMILEGAEIAEEPILEPTEEIPEEKKSEEPVEIKEPTEASPSEMQKPIEIVELPEAKPETQKPVELVPLRESAEKKGFTVTWTANDKPVLLQKDGVTIEITLGKAEYKKGNEVLKSEKAAELKDSKIYVGSDVIE